jgi:hypothetical protein
MINREAIKIFARDTLGCGCPDEVFDVIECRSGFMLKGNILLRNRLNIGNRLLIYIIDKAAPDFLENNMVTILHNGVNERDRMRFNRFRLVIAADNPHQIQEMADDLFNTVAHDEKTHVHYISMKDIPDFESGDARE